MIKKKNGKDVSVYSPINEKKMHRKFTLIKDNN